MAKQFHLTLSRGVAACLIHLVAGVALAAAQDWPRLSLSSPVGQFEEPVHITHAGDGSQRLFVVELTGRIWIVRDGSVLPTPFLDLTSRLDCGDGRKRLLSIAFPPNYAGKQHFYVKYLDKSCSVVVSRFHATANPDVGNPNSEQIVLQQPVGNGLFGGPLVFGPDGYLYLSLGDGSASDGDSTDESQDPALLLGKMLRIDVETGNPETYTIPASNPFVGRAGYRGEIWAFGFRNPWRFSFDRQTGDLYIGDVGSGSREEVNFQPAGSPGGENYGWKIMEGDTCYRSSTCNSSGLTLPLVQYDHTQGCSVTGGFVYRGSDYPTMQGIYLFGDWCSGRIWGLRRNAGGQWETELLAETGLSVLTFGEDEAGNLFVSDYNEGWVYPITASATAPVISGLQPASAIAGGSAFSLLVSGNLFAPDAEVRWNGSPRPTTVNSASELAAHISAADITTSGTALITVINPSTGEQSNARSFSIVRPAPVLTLTSPNGGETWVGGSVQTIGWTYEGELPSSVKIELLNGGEPVRTISSNAPLGTGGTGSFNWTIPPTQAPSIAYAVRISSSLDASSNDASDSAFTIVAPVLTVAAPNGGDNWIAGASHMIRWNYTGNPGAQVRLELLKAGTAVSVLTSGTSIGTSGVGSFLWTIPPTLTAGSDYTIRVSSTATSTTDVSNATFTILAPTITVMAPNGGETWPAGSRPSIGWTYTGNPGSRVKIELLKAGAVAKIVTTSAPVGAGGAGSYSWTLSSNLAAGIDYSIRITSTTSPATDTSNAPFTILAPTLTLLTPNGGEKWTAGDRQTIRWNYTGNPGAQLKIELLKAGTVVRVLSYGASIGSSGTGSFGWTIPYNQTPGADYTIRIVSTTNAAIADATNSVFSVDPPIITIAATDPTAMESGQDPGTFTVQRSGGTSVALTIQYILGGTATNGSDYASLNGVLTIPIGATSAQLRVTPVNDTRIETNETVLVTLRPLSTYTVGAASVAVVNIISNE